MNTPRISSVIASLVEERGTMLLAERRQLLGLLRDRLPGEVRAIRILMMAFDGGILERMSGTTPSGSDISRESAVFAAEMGLASEAARQAVETWATALCGYTAAQGAASSQARPQARRLPARSTAAVVAARMKPAETVVRQPGAPWRWPAVMLGLIILLGGISRFLQKPDEIVTPPVAVPVAPAPAAPSRPAPAPAAPRAPATPAPASPATPMPASPAPQPPIAQTTPEGFALISQTRPYPLFQTERIKQNVNTLLVSFGVKANGLPVTYFVGLGFNKGQLRGQGIIGATKDGRTVKSEIVDANRVTIASTQETFLRVSGTLGQNEMGLPGLCAFVQVSDNMDQIEVAPNGRLVIFAIQSDGSCDMRRRVGFGTLR